MICSFGCEQEAEFYSQGSKLWRCSEFAASCPARRAQHSIAMKGRAPWNVGKHLSESYRAKLSAANKGNPNCTGYALTEERELLRRQRISDKAKISNGGFRKGSGVGKKSWHDSPVAGKVHCQSSYELRMAILLDKSGLKWKRNSERFYFTWNEKQTYYVPDFVIDCNGVELLIETKGFKTEKDEAKWKSCTKPLFVVYLQELQELETLVVHGELAEWFIATTSKVAPLGTWVRIPHSPPFSSDLH